MYVLITDQSQGCALASLFTNSSPSSDRGGVGRLRTSALVSVGAPSMSTPHTHIEFPQKSFATIKCALKPKYDWKLSEDVVEVHNLIGG